MLRFQPLGDAAVLVELGSSPDEETHKRVRAAQARLGERKIAGVIEVVPAFTTVAVYYDVHGLGRSVTAEGGSPLYASMVERLEEALAELELIDLPPSREVEIPVCYGGDLGPDLDWVAQQHGISADEVARIHSAGTYLVHMMGFAPGFGYLGGLDERIATPRRPTPRTSVPAGSVGIAGRQTGVYPIQSPGGWQIIGRTPLTLFTPFASSPTLLSVGDRVRFRQIFAEEYRALAGAQ